MIVRVLVMMRVGAALWIERRLYFDDFSAELDCHLGYDVIAPDAQRCSEQLGRHVSIAEMPSETNALQQMGAANLQERFRCGNDFDQPPVLQDQRVAAVQPGCVRQIKQKGNSLFAPHRDAPPVTIVIVEDDAIRGFTRPGRSRFNGGCTHRRDPALKRNDFRLNRHSALACCLSMIFSENRYPLFGIML
jgi:hypothetical protein